MKANCWYGKHDVRVVDVPDPEIINKHDAIVKITSTAICGSDLHLYNGFMPTMEKGDVLGHEFMGEVVEVGPKINEDQLKVGDRVVVPFPIACGFCAACRNEMFSLCENSNPNAWMAEKVLGHSPAGLFGYSHMLGGYAGGAGGVRARPVCGHRTAQGAARVERRAGSLSLRRLPDRLHGRGDVRHRAERRRRGVG